MNQGKKLISLENDVVFSSYSHRFKADVPLEGCTVKHMKRAEVSLNNSKVVVVKGIIISHSNIE